tara:strand:- start:1794 stop:2333 length:540 start_codon:yes stop_codon:yes gene_type:complete
VKKLERWLIKMKKVQRYFLDYDFLKNKKVIEIKNENLFSIILNDKKNYEVNKFFYKQIGKDHFWRDRLIWTDKQWLRYSSNPLLDTWIIKSKKNDLIGYYEIEKHENKEFELINMGILNEYRSKGFGSLLLTHVLKQSYNNKARKVWVHTCSLDHKFALTNYISRGFKVFKKEQIDFVA